MRRRLCPPLCCFFRSGCAPGLGFAPFRRVSATYLVYISWSCVRSLFGLFFFKSLLCYTSPHAEKKTSQQCDRWSHSNELRGKPRKQSKEGYCWNTRRREARREDCLTAGTLPSPIFLPYRKHRIIQTLREHSRPLDRGAE